MVRGTIPVLLPQSGEPANAATAAGSPAALTPPQFCATRKAAAPGTYGRAKKEIGLDSKWNPALS